MIVLLHSIFPINIIKQIFLFGFPFRVESFIEHQDACNLRQIRSDQFHPTAAAAPPPLPPLLQPYSRSISYTGASTSNDHIFQRTTPLRGFPILSSNNSDRNFNINLPDHHDLELHLSSPSSAFLKLSIGSPNYKDQANEDCQLERAMTEKAYADEARREAKRQIEIAEVEFANANMIRQQAQAELEKARILKEEASRKMSSTIMEITCQTCRLHFHMNSAAAEETSLAISYMSSATTEGDGEWMLDWEDSNNVANGFTPRFDPNFKIQF